MKFKIGEKIIGVYDMKTHVLRKRVLKSRHYFRVGGEWGIDYKMLEALPDDAIIVLEELEDKKWYWLSKKEIVEKGRDLLGYKGYGLQRMVKLGDWSTLTPEQEEENEYRKNQGLELKYIPQ